MNREHRRHKRYDVNDVRGSLALNAEAELLNMSLTGMAIATRAMLKVGGKCTLRIPHQGGTLTVPADVKWCRLVSTERTASGDVVPVYQAGLDFRQILDEKARQMLELIESSIVVELERRLSGRFKVVVEGPVELRAWQPFEVRRISLSGMLIETDLIAEVGTVFDLEIEPDGTPIELRGRVAHLRALAEGERGELGVEFLALSAESRRALEALIEAQLE
jgi:hypothetical protein